MADNILLQDISNCGQYIACMNRKPKTQQCGNGLYFDVVAQNCTASRLGCLQCTKGEFVMMPLANTCNKYVLCFDGTLIIQQCHNDLQFNSKIGKCDLPKNVDCVANRCPVYNSSGTNLTYVPSAVSCENYYVCMNDQPKQLSCASGLYFSTKCNCCDNAENVSCSIKKSVTSEHSAAKGEIVEAKPAKKHLHRTVVSEMANISCPNIGTFVFPHANRNQYYLCLDGNGSLLACPEGHFFDEKLKACLDVMA